MLQKDEYIKTVRRLYPPFFNSLQCSGHSDEKNYVSFLKEPFRIQNLAHVNKFWYYSRAELNTVGTLALQSWRDRKFFEKAKKEFKRRARALTKAASSTFESFCRAHKKYMPALIIIFAVDKHTEAALRNALLKKLSTKETENLMDALNTPLLDNYYKQEEYELITTKNLAKHVKKYHWLLARYGEEREYTLKEAQAKLRGINKEAYLQKRKTEKEKLRQAIARAKKLLGKNSNLVDIFQFVIYYRTHRTDTINKTTYLALPLLKKKAARLGITYQEFLFCSADEVRKGKIPSSSILQSRMQDCSTLLEDRRVRVFSGEDSKKLIEFFHEEVEDVTEFRGAIACKGKARGRVKIIKDRNDFGKISTGDILVTSMTTPDMIPIMKKAAAFVTDEGGVTSHAAIISREMRKPCIIGTKIATRVLQDGDLVEVDANTGIVNKI